MRERKREIEREIERVEEGLEAHRCVRLFSSQHCWT
jgi:hypothetical protein